MTAKALRAIDVVFDIITNFFKKMFVIVLVTGIVASLLTIMLMTFAMRWL